MVTRPKGKTRSKVSTERVGTAKASRGRPRIYSRAAILEEAKIAFSKSGYSNVTLDDLADRLKTGKGTLYYHASRKIDLLVSISRNAVRASVGELQKIQEMKASPDVKFMLAMRTHINGILSDQQSTKIYFENEANLPPPIKGELRAILREIETIFVSIVSEGVRMGLFICGQRTVLMTVRHIMALCAWPYRWYSAHGSLSKAAFIDTAVDFALSALRTGDGLARIREASGKIDRHGSSNEYAIQPVGKARAPSKLQRGKASNRTRRVVDSGRY